MAARRVGRRSVTVLKNVAATKGAGRPAQAETAGKLGTYRAKRDFSSTPEPSGDRAAARSYDGRLRFVVQRHRARRLHYDLRLELDGVLVSWAVPKGPSLDAKVRSLAVKVEDHPLDYGWFEGVIPAGYGKGDVIVWDDGWWELDPEDDRDLDAGDGDRAGRVEVRAPRAQARGPLRHRRARRTTSGCCSTSAATTRWPAGNPRTTRGPCSAGGRTRTCSTRSPARWDGPTVDELRALDELGAKGEWTVAGVPRLGDQPRQGVRSPGVTAMRGPITKRDIIRYYARIAPWIAPYLAGRPVNLNRFPDGIERGGFWHKAVPTHAPDWVRRWPNPLADEGETRDYLLVDGAPALVWAANFAGIEIHPWTSTAAAPEEPSYALVDIDPGTETTWDETLTPRAALPYCDRPSPDRRPGEGDRPAGHPDLDPGPPRLHVRRHARVRRDAVAERSAPTVPDLVSWRWQKNERRGLARLDYTQNMINKTLVAPYSLRPAPGAPVSVAIEWDGARRPRPAPGPMDDQRRLRTARSDVGDPFTALVGIDQELPAL